MKNSLWTDPVLLGRLGTCLLAAVLLVVLVWGLFQAYFRLRGRGKSSGKVLLHKALRFQPRAFLGAALYAVLLCASTFALASTSAQVSITLNYAEASSGENTNGTRFNMSEIIGTEVLSRAIEKGALEDVTSQELGRCLTIEPVVQGNSYDETGYHIATEFVVTYQASRNTSHLDAENVARLIAGAYKEFYIDTYANNFSVLEWESSDEEALAELDYLDAADYLQNFGYTVSNYLYALGEQNSTFASSQGDTFYSLASRVDQLGQVQIQDRLRSYLLTDGISKDTQAYVGRLEYENVMTDFDMQRASASFQVRSDAVDLYAEEMTRIVLVPTWDEDGEYYMGRTKVGIDDLSMEGEDYSQQAASQLETIETNRSVIASLEDSSSGEDPTAQQLLDEISATLQDYAEAARTAGQEFSETRMNQCISAGVTSPSQLRALSLSLVFALLFYAALCFLLAGREMPRADFETAQERQEETVHESAK